jgi:tRNA(Arg) A34 adenosine deaminase TadA
MRHLNLAKKIAVTSNHKKSRHGAVLIKGGSVISVAKNSNRYSSFGQRFMPRQKNWLATHHAELGCILGLDKSITKGTTIYVARVSKEGEVKNSKPCELCQAVLKHVGVRKAIYTTEDGWGCMKL